MKKSLTLILFLLVLSTPHINAQDYAVSLKASTIGMHVEVFRSFGTDFDVHLGGSFFSYTYNQTPSPKDDYLMNADLKLNSFTLLGDWFPFASYTFRLSAGLSYNNNKPNVVAVPTINKIIGGDVYNKDNLGNLGVDLSFNKINPYIGIGLGKPTDGVQGFGYTVDLGVYYQGSPKVKLSADGLLAPSASPVQEAIVEKNLNWFQWFPVVSFGLSYTF